MKARKPRSHSVQWHSDQPIVANGVKVYHDGYVELLLNGKPVVPDRAFSEVTYDRSKRPKVLTRAFVTGARLPVNPLASLGSVDRIYWVDTSIGEYRGQRIHATSVKLGEPVHGPRYTLLRAQTIHGFEFRGTIEAPERLAWSETIERLRLNPERVLNWSIVLVVDSDLTALSKINARETALWGDYMLPPAFQFLYASADVGKELGLNAIMARCDRSATSLLEHILKIDPEGKGLTERTHIGNVPCRSWSPID